MWLNNFTNFVDELAKYGTVDEVNGNLVIYDITGEGNHDDAELMCRFVGDFFQIVESKKQLGVPYQVYFELMNQLAEDNVQYETVLKVQKTTDLCKRLLTQMSVGETLVIIEQIKANNKERKNASYQAQSSQSGESVLVSEHQGELLEGVSNS